MAYSDPKKQKEFQRNWQRKVRLENKQKVVDLLGGGCCVCGYKRNIAALQIDHIKPLRREDRRRGVTTGSNLIRNILLGKEKVSDLQLLCANCHAIKSYQERDLI